MKAAMSSAQVGAAEGNGGGTEGTRSFEVTGTAAALHCHGTALNALLCNVWHLVHCCTLLLHSIHCSAVRLLLLSVHCSAMRCCCTAFIALLYGVVSALLRVAWRQSIRECAWGVRNQGGL